jgi:hypothetical protein
LAASLALPAHAWFFFLLPGSLFRSNDKAAVEKLEREGDWDGMQKLAAKRLEVDPRNPAWLYISGYAYQKRGECSFAVPMYKMAIENKNNSYPEAARNIEACQRTLEALHPTPVSAPAPHAVPVAVSPPPTEAAPSSARDSDAPEPAGGATATAGGSRAERPAIERLRELKQMRDENLITQEQFESKRVEILRSE